MKRLLFVSALLIASCQSYSSDLPQPILVGVGTEAKWSPNEAAIAFRRGDSLYVKSLSPDKPAQGIYYAPIVSFEWLNDSTLATYEKQYFPVKGGRTRVERMAKVSLNGLAVEIVKDSMNEIRGPRVKGFKTFSNGSVGYFDSFGSDNKPIQLSQPTAAAGKPSDTTSLSLFVGTVPGPWGKVWLYYGSKLNGRQVTLSDNYYLHPQLAPLDDRITCFAARGDLVIFDTLGKELANVGPADFVSWSPDGQDIVFCVTKEAGDPGDIVASDIYIAKWDGSDRRLIGNTPDLVEIDPTFSPSGTKLLYREYPSDKLFVIRLK
jgi:hypothetical protein